MKQIEITIRLNENLNSATKKLEAKGFKIIRESDVDGIYVTTNDNKKYLKSLNKENQRKK